MHRSIVGAGALAIALAAWSAQAGAQALVVNGEEIADAKLMAAARAEGKVEVYGAYPTEAIKPVLEQFKEDTKLDLEYVRLPSAKMYDRVLAEFGANKLGADYADLTDLTLMKQWVSRGVLASYKVPWDAKIAAPLKDPGGHWYYIVRPIYVIGVNTAEVAEKDFPKSWKDTLDPKWKGRLGMQSIDAGGSALTMQSFLRIKVADDAWQRLAKIDPRLYATIAPVGADLVRGRVALAYIDANSVAVQMGKGAPLKIIFPSEGLASFGAFGNVTATAKHPNAGRLWVNYVTSKRGSTAMASSGAYGTHPDAPPPHAAGYTFPSHDKVWTIDPAEWDRIHESWPKEWKTVMGKK